MKNTMIRRLMLSCLCLIGLTAAAVAGTFTGKVSDLDAGNGYLSVTSKADQDTKTFKVTVDTQIVNADGSASQLLSLVETTRVKVEYIDGQGNVATKITVLPDETTQLVP